MLTTDHAQSGLGNFTTAGDTEEVTCNEEKSESAGAANNPESPDEEGLSSPEDEPCGLIYARVSSGNQLKGDEDDEDTEYDEGSIEGQIEELTELANKEGIHLPYDPITDEAKTGTNFDRGGIQEVFEISKRKDIDYLSVEKVDRIGRSAPEPSFEGSFPDPPEVLAIVPPVLSILMCAISPLLIRYLIQSCGK